MLTAYTCENGRLQRVTDASAPESLQRAVWIDLLSATIEESERAAAATGLRIPVEADLSEIEASSRLSTHDGALYISMPLTTRDKMEHRAIPAGFVLSADRLITIRFAPSHLFEHFAERQPRDNDQQGSSGHLFVGLLETIVDRQADELEQVRAELDTISHR
ncbi:MAG TPA: CorA family divalent cation transporter, partial [Acetobacteraceae bacterium]|nr:CorA family divalent cation transporter [Acetobacteraceae bacterium]